MVLIKMKMLSILFILASILFPLGVSANHHIRTQDINDICTTKTSTIRNVPEKIKRQVYLRDGYSNGKCNIAKGCEVDHRISLELGGTNDSSNLMIQSYFGKCNAHDKDKLENKLHALMCSNQISVQDAQDIIYDDWKAGYSQFVNANGCDK